MKSRSLYVGDFLARSALLAWNTLMFRKSETQEYNIKESTFRL